MAPGGQWWSEERRLQAAVGTPEGVPGRGPLRAFPALREETLGLCPLPHCRDPRPAFSTAEPLSPPLPCFFFEGGVLLPPPEPRLPTRASRRAVRGGAWPARWAAEVGGGSQLRQPPCGGDRPAHAELSCSPRRAAALHRRSGRNWACVWESSSALSGSAGNHQTDRRQDVWLPPLNRNGQYVLNLNSDSSGNESIPKKKSFQVL